MHFRRGGAIVGKENNECVIVQALLFQVCEEPAEMMIEVLRIRRRVVEVPVSYYPRIGGESKHSGSFFHLAKTATKMLRIIFRKRFLGR